MHARHPVRLRDQILADRADTELTSAAQTATSSPVKTKAGRHYAYVKAFSTAARDNRQVARRGLNMRTRLPVARSPLPDAHAMAVSTLIPPSRSWLRVVEA